MATLVKTYNFDSAQGWAYTVSGDGSGAWQSSGGNSGGCWAINCLGRKSLESGYLELSTTWEALGVPANSTINEIDANSLDWLCDVYNVADGYTIGALEVRDSGGTLQATLKSSQAGSGTTSYASYSNASPVSIPASIQASDSSVRIRLNFVLDTGNNASAEVNLLIDNISFTVDYSAAAIDIVANDSYHDNILSTGDVTQTHLIQANDLSNDNTLEAGDITQSHLIQTDNLYHENVLESGEIQIAIDIVAANLYNENVLESVSITQVHELIANNLSHLVELSEGIISQTHNVEANDLFNTHELDNPNISQEHNINASDNYHLNYLESPTISQSHNLVAEDCFHLHDLESPDMEGEINIVAFDLSHDSVLESVNITQSHILLADNISHENILSDVIITQVHKIIATDLFNNNELENIDITQEHIIFADNCYHDCAIEVIGVFSVGAIISYTQCKKCKASSTKRTVRFVSSITERKAKVSSTHRNPLI